MTISASILQNELRKHLPAEFLNEFHEGVEIAYVAIPYITDLQEPLRTEVRAAFANSLAIVWKTMAGIAGVGLLSVLLLREVPLRGTVDTKFALEGRSEDDDETKCEVAV